MATKKSTTTSKAPSHGLKSANATLLKHPRITEKAANLGSHNIYLFEVAVGATKSEIAKAFFATYNQKPIKVNTVNAKPKSYYRRGVLGFGARTKKAYIILPKGTTIDIG